MLLHLGWRNRPTGKSERKLAVTDPSLESWVLLSIFLVSSAIMILILIALWAILIYPITVWEEKELEERFSKE